MSDRKSAVPGYSPDYSALVARVEGLLSRLETILPKPPAAPDVRSSTFL